MKRFCIECGKEAAQEHSICIYCGTPLPKIDVPTDDVDDASAESFPEESGDDFSAEDIDGSSVGATHLGDFSETHADDAADDASDDESDDAENTASPDATAKKETAATTIGAGAGAGTAEASATPATAQQDKAGKKNKVLWRIGAIVAVILIGLFVWTKNYTSSEAVEERFQKAIDQENVSQLQKLMVHGDGTAIEAFEAEAFLALVKSEGRDIVYSLTDTVYDGKFLFIFDSYKIEAQDQIPYGDNIEDLTYTFNEAEVAVFDEDEENIAFGPLAPGIYKVEVNFSSEFGELSLEEDVILDDTSYQEYTYMDIDIPLAQVSIYIDNAENIGHENITVKVGDKEFSLNEEGETGVIGAMLTDGSVTAQIVATLPWGEVESEPIPIEDNEPWMTAAYLADDHLKDISDSISNFGEQFLEARATESTKPVKNISKDAKEKVALYFYDYGVYSGQLNSIGINEDEMYMYETEDGEARLAIPVQYYTSEDIHGLEDTPDLYDELYTFDIIFSYKTDDKSWFIENFDAFAWEFEPTKEWDGAGKLYGPSEEQVKKASEKSFDDEMEAFLIEYTNASVDAINERDFSIVSEYITKNGPRREEARDYIDYLDSKDIYETWIDTELEKIEELDKNEWKVTLQEEFEIIRPDSDDQWRFRTVLIVKEVDGQLLVDELISTDRLD